MPPSGVMTSTLSHPARLLNGGPAAYRCGDPHDRAPEASLSAWRRCDDCRKVLPAQAYDGDAATCRSCLTGPAPRVRTARASAVTTTRAARPPTVPSERQPLLGKAGSGDLEVRERRARRAAMEQLAAANAEEFEQLLSAARQAEGLRA